MPQSELHPFGLLEKYPPGGATLTKATGKRPQPYVETPGTDGNLPSASSHEPVLFTETWISAGGYSIRH
jgi:hypothetical protein